MVRHPAATIGYSNCIPFLFLIQAKLWTATKNGIESHSFTGSLDLTGAYRRTFWEFTEPFNSKYASSEKTSLPSWLIVRVLILVQNCILLGKSSGFSSCLLIGRYGWYLISVDILDQLDLIKIKEFQLAELTGEVFLAPMCLAAYLFITALPWQHFLEFWHVEIWMNFQDLSYYSHWVLSLAPLPFYKFFLHDIKKAVLRWEIWAQNSL